MSGKEGARDVNPALANRQSTRPIAAIVEAKAAMTAPSSATSTASWWVRPASAAFSASSASRLRSSRRPQTTTSAPCFAQPVRKPRPMPLLAPAASTTRPVRSKRLRVKSCLLAGRDGMELQIIGEIGVEILLAEAPFAQRISVDAVAALRILLEPAPHPGLAGLRPIVAEPAIDALHLRERIGEHVVIVEMIEIVRPLGTDLQRP